MAEKQLERIPDAVVHMRRVQSARRPTETIAMFKLKNQWGLQAPDPNRGAFLRVLYRSAWVETISPEHVIALNIGLTFDGIKDEVTRALQRIETTTVLRQVVRDSLRGLRIETIRLRRDLAKLTEEHRKLAEQVKSLLEIIEDRPIVSQTRLRDLNSDTHRLKTPILVTVEQYTDEVTARWPEAETFGAGATETLALADLKKEIVSLFEDIEQLKRTEPDRLGKPLQSVARVLGDTIEKLNG